jgi:hypothetical protein
MSGRIILSTGRRLGKKTTATGPSKQVREGGYPFRIPTWLPTLGRRWVAIVGPRSEFQIYFFAFFAFFHFFSLYFSHFFAFFSLFSLFFALNFSLRFDLVIFASKRSEIQVYFSLFPFFFHFFFDFFAFFCLFFNFFA